MAWTPCSALAVEPRDFEHAWSVVTATPNPAYHIELSEELMRATRHHWADAAVLDARDEPMPFGIFDGTVAAPFQSSPLKCALQAAPDSPNLVYRCVLQQAVENVYGVRVRTPFRSLSRPLDVVVRDQSGAELARFNGASSNTPSLFLDGGAPIAFDGPHRIESLEFEMLTVDQELEDVRLVAPPLMKLARWHGARLVQEDADGKTFVYAVEFPVRVQFVRFGLEEAWPATGRLYVSACFRQDCTGWTAMGEADALALGSGKPSAAVQLGQPSEQPYLQVKTSVALRQAPQLEIAWTPPSLTFSANGTQPYTFVVGQTTVPTNARYNFSRDMYPAGKPEATLAPYSATNRFGSRLLDLAGPALLIFALLLAGYWVYGPRQRGD